MSPKLNNYSGRDKAKIRPRVSVGGGVGFISDKEMNLLNEQTVITFQLVNLTPSANNVAQDDQVTPFTEDSVVYIQHDEGIIGEAPASISKKIVSLLHKGIRLTGSISKIVKNKSNLNVEVTLVPGK